MGFADGIHIKSAGMQLWAAAFARLMTSAEAVDPSRLAVFTSCSSGVEKEWKEERKKWGGGSSWSPALSEVSHLANIWIANAGKVICCHAGIASSLHSCQPLWLVPAFQDFNWNMQWQAYISFLYSFSLSCLSLSPPYSCPSSPLPYLLIPPHHPVTSLVHFPSVSLRHQGAFPPQQDAWQGSRWSRERMTNLSVSLPLPPSPPLSSSRPSSAFIHPPSSAFPSYLTALIFKSAQSAFHLPSLWSSGPTSLSLNPQH